MLRSATALTFLLALACSACGGGGGGGTANPGTVTAGGGQTPPAISTHPASQSVAEGAPVTFSVAASGSTVSYQWRRDGSPIAGATGSSYTLPAAQLADRGSRWSVQVSNPAGAVTSSEAVLTVSGIRVLAGSANEYGFASGAGTQARFHEPFGIALDASGNVFASDFYNQTIRKIDPTGQVTTFAGAVDLYGRVDGDGENARFSYPTGLAFDKTGNLFVADSAFRLIRKVTPQGLVSTVAQLPKGTSVDGYSSGMFQPSGIALDSADNIYVTSGVGTRRIAPDGSYAIIEGDDTRDSVPTMVVPLVRGVALGQDGSVFATSLQNDIRKLLPSASVVGGSGGMQGYLAVDRHGNLYVADYANAVVRKVSASGEVSVIAGNGTRGTQIGNDLKASLPPPRGIAVDADGVLYVAMGHAIVKIYQP